MPRYIEGPIWPPHHGGILTSPQHSPQGSPDRKVSHLSATRRLTVPASIPMVNVVGPRDEFLRLLEGELDADILVRGNEITLTGAAADIALASDAFT